MTTTPTNNTEFLQAVFAGLNEPHRPFVLGFAGNPEDRKGWRGDAWQAGKTSTENASLKATLNKPSKISAQTWMTQFFGLLCLSRGPFGQFAGR